MILKVNQEAINDIAEIKKVYPRGMLQSRCRKPYCG